MNRLLAPALAAVALLASPTVALAVCKDPPCVRDPGTTPTPTPVPPPVVTRITGVSPSFAWSGDTLTLSGSGFYGASVTINGLPATVKGVTVTTLTVVVPPLTGLPAGPNQIPVVVTSPTGTASASFTLSPSLQLSTAASYGTNAQFGQGMDGSARATATLDRSSGFENTALTVVDQQFWLSLSINTSTVWLDGDGVVVGYTPVRNVTASGFFFHPPNGDTTTSGSFTDVVLPSPAVAPGVRSAQIILVRDHDKDLTNALSNAVAVAKTIWDLYKLIAAFV